MKPDDTQKVRDALHLLNAHYDAFYHILPVAERMGHPVPCDTRAWSQILISLLTGIHGRMRKKGTDLEDGSDVKAANCWSAIDTPRFNGAIPAGRVSEKARKTLDVSALDDIPFIFFVLWDHTEHEQHPRCRIWCIRAVADSVFRAVCAKWYSRKSSGGIKSVNFQLHPPRNLDSNVIRNTCGNMEFPLLFSAVRPAHAFVLQQFDPDIMKRGGCRLLE